MCLVSSKPKKFTIKIEVSLTYKHTHSLFLCFSLSFSLPLSFSLSFSLPLSFFGSFFVAPSKMVSRNNGHTGVKQNTFRHTHSLIHTLAYTLSLTYTHKHTPTPPYTHKWNRQKESKIPFWVGGCRVHNCEWILYMFGLTENRKWVFKQSHSLSLAIFCGFICAHTTHYTHTHTHLQAQVIKTLFIVNFGIIKIVGWEKSENGIIKNNCLFIRKFFYD